MEYADKNLKILEDSERRLHSQFLKYEKIAFENQCKVLDAFKKNKVSMMHFNGTSGYGYDDIGRDTLQNVYSDIFCTESAIVSPHLLSGTHALTVGLFGILRPNDMLLSITGEPYDTMIDVISKNGTGSLKDFGITYNQIDLKNNSFDEVAILSFIKSTKVKLIYLQRSRGYNFRNAISMSDIKNICDKIKNYDSDICIFVDNCYGEFVDTIEPTNVGADIVVGSLIKNIGGGITTNGGYIVGKKHYLKQIEGRFTAPSVGAEIGSYALGYMQFFQGLFMAPHVTLQALKSAMLFSAVFSNLGYNTLPKYTDSFNDIICSIVFKTEQELTNFCKCIQSVSPVDSHVTPIAWGMPGYADKVIMAAGCFVQGASIELSCDSPIREPYIAYLQGGLTYEHAKIAVLKCMEVIEK